MGKLKLYWYDWMILGIGILMLFSEYWKFGVFTLLFMASFYITEKIGEKKNKTQN